MGTHSHPARARQGLRQMLRVLGLGAALIVTASVLSTGRVEAQDPGRGAQAREDLVARLVGKKVRIDPATQRPRAIDVAEARELVTQIVAMIGGSADTLTEIQRPDGSAMASLEGHVGHVLIARPNEDGRTSIRCVTSADEAVDFLTEEELPVR
jgi:hypothetical protein